MQRFPIVQNLDGLKASEFADPEARVDAANVVGRMELSDSLSGILIGAADAGLPMILKIVPVRRQNGIFIVAAALSSVPADAAKSVQDPELIFANAETAMLNAMQAMNAGESKLEKVNDDGTRTIFETKITTIAAEEKSPAGNSEK